MLQVEHLARLILWLNKREWGLVLILSLVSFIVVVFVNVSYPNRLFDVFNGPIFDAGYHVGTIFFPDYVVRHTTGSYVVPLFGAGADLLMLMAFWFIVLRLLRSLLTEKTDTDLHQPL